MRAFAVLVFMVACTVAVMWLIVTSDMWVPGKVIVAWFALGGLLMSTANSLPEVE